ncbi:MAG: 3-phosphoshikimate 1-carboxyvinyltransferase [Lentimicrobiaceae bacterium]|nr:3-phosphoshikimate 1-carboxyvinyltransferase [Lentimicrobiaceae bacterium]
MQISDCKIPSNNKSIFKVNLPLSKSISNRLLVLQYLSGKAFDINYSDANDTVLLQKLLKLISENKNLSTPITIDAQDAGTTLRFLTAVLSITPGNWYLTGTERMQQRPIKPLVDALLSLGADIKYAENDNFVPLIIKGKSNFKGGEVAIDATKSSQFVSAMMLIAPVIAGGLTILLSNETVSEPYIFLTQDALKQAGAEVVIKDKKIIIQQGFNNDCPKAVEPDWTAAAYWYQIASLMPNAKVLLSDLSVNSLQADSVLPVLYSRLGVKTTQNKDGIILENEGSCNPKFYFDFISNPDILQSIAVTCCAKNISAKLTGLSTLQYKETNRLEAIYTELEKLGFDIKIIDGDLIISTIDDSKIDKTEFYEIKTYQDHRMAMSIAPLALAGYKLKIDNPDVVNKSYPKFWQQLIDFGFVIS